MERRYNLRARVSGRVQAANTTQHFRPQQYVPPAGVPPSSDVHSLRRALLSAEEDNLKLSSENAALHDVNKKLMNDNSCLQRTLGRKLVTAKQDIHRLETALKASKAGQDESKKREEAMREKEKEISSLRQSLRAQKEETERVRRTELDQSINKCNALDQKFKKELAEREESWERRRKETEKQWQEKEDALTSSLRESLRAQKEETERVRDFWMKERDEMSAAFDSELKMVKSVCDAQRSADLQQMQTDCQRKVSQLQEQITEQDKVISTIREEMKARTEEHLITSSQLGLRQTELDQSINKCSALDQKFKKELAEREESWERRQEEMMKQWLENEDALMKKASKAEEELKLVIIKNIHLQELALKKKKKKKRKRGLWGKKRQRSSSEEEEAAMCLAQAGQEERKKEKKRRNEASGEKGSKTTVRRRLWCVVELRMDRRRRERRRNRASGAGLARRTAATATGRWRKVLFVHHKLGSSKTSILHPPLPEP